MSTRIWPPFKARLFVLIVPFGFSSGVVKPSHARLPPFRFRLPIACSPSPTVVTFPLFNCREAFARTCVFAPDNPNELLPSESVPVNPLFAALLKLNTSLPEAIVTFRSPAPDKALLNA